METQEIPIEEITQNVWGSMIGLELQAAPGVAVMPPSKHSISGCVHISGAWDGSVVFECAMNLARRATELMLGMEAGSASSDDVYDAVGELTNMIGGNLKSLVPFPSQLSLPSVIEGTDLKLRIPGTQCLKQVAFELNGDLVLISVMQKDRVAGTPAPSQVSLEQAQ